MINKFLCALVLFFGFFPWLSFGILNVDMQPYCLLVSLLIFFLNFNKLFPARYALLLVLAMGSFLVGVVYFEFNFLTFRAWSTYASPFFISFAYFLVKQLWRESFSRVVFFVGVIWFVVALLQFFVSKDFFSFLVSVRSTDDRGVTGLAPEPTFYALYLVVLSWIYLRELDYRFDELKTKIFLLINLFSIVFLAKSAMVILILILVVFFVSIVYMFTRPRSIFYLCLIGIVCFPLVLVSSKFMEKTRVFTVFSSLIESPRALLVVDESVNERVKHIVYPLHAAFLKFLLPNGYNEFFNDSQILNVYYDGLFFEGRQNDKIMSGMAAMLYELGWFAIFFIWFLLGSFSSVLTKRGLIEVFSVSCLLFVALPMSFPLLYFLFCRNDTCER